MNDVLRQFQEKPNSSQYRNSSNCTVEFTVRETVKKICVTAKATFFWSQEKKVKLDFIRLVGWPTI